MEFYILTTEKMIEKYSSFQECGNLIIHTKLNMRAASERMIFSSFERAEHWINNISNNVEKYACLNVYMDNTDILFCLSQLFYSRDASCFDDCSVKILDIKWIN